MASVRPIEASWQGNFTIAYTMLVNKDYTEFIYKGKSPVTVKSGQKTFQIKPGERFEAKQNFDRIRISHANGLGGMSIEEATPLIKNSEKQKQEILKISHKDVDKYLDTHPR